ncbi:sensor histidine kinase [Alkalinema pantanalense CENA528]|uniref:sensor histidine kinase n=1 Tax=Alkalinema pantanalense TaxID=1620705 RepID=UPI003D6F8C5B
MVTGILSDRIATYASALDQQQAQLEAHNKLVGLREDFAGTLTHDLKIGAIATLDAFQQGQFDTVSAPQQKILMTMVRSHQTSLELVETLLNVYRNDLEGLALTLIPLDLTQLVEEVANQMTLLATNRQVYLSVHHSDSEFRRILWVRGDTLQLKRVLTNLLTNAINHSRRGDRVEVILETVNGHHCVKVLDMGAGIQPEEFSQLFQRFYQGNSDRQAKGSGLGLYLARQIITAHGGKIWAENRSPYLPPKGAMFGISLPVYLPE